MGQLCQASTPFSILAITLSHPALSPDSSHAVVLQARASDSAVHRCTRRKRGCEVQRDQAGMNLTNLNVRHLRRRSSSSVLLRVFPANLLNMLRRRARTVSAYMHVARLSLL